MVLKTNAVVGREVKSGVVLKTNAVVGREVKSGVVHPDISRRHLIGRRKLL